MRIQYERSADHTVDVKGGRSLPDSYSEVFEVVGAGFVAFGESTGCRCGTATGCGVAASWGKWGYYGGVMDVSEMERLRDFLNERLQ